MHESEGNVIICNNNKQQGQLLFPIATNDSSVVTVHKDPLFPFMVENRTGYDNNCDKMFLV